MGVTDFTSAEHKASWLWESRARRRAHTSSSSSPQGALLLHRCRGSAPRLERWKPGPTALLPPPAAPLTLACEPGTAALGTAGDGHLARPGTEE